MILVLGNGGLGLYKVLILGGLILSLLEDAFLISDLILAVNRFIVEFKEARILDLLTCYTGQWLIALSVIGLTWLGM